MSDDNINPRGDFDDFGKHDGRRPTPAPPDADPSTPHEVDFQHIPTGGFFAECTQPNRSGYTAADARTYAVRIYPTCT